MKEQEHFIPWYQPDATVDSTDICRRLRSAAYVYVSQSKPKSQSYTSSREAYRSADLVFMELTVRARKDFRNEIPFQWPDDVYKVICNSWYEEQKCKGIWDIVYLCGTEVEAVTKRNHYCCLVCWYADGDVKAFIPGEEVKDGTTKPVIKPIALSQQDYHRPEFPDNAVTFKKALEAIAAYAPFDYWINHFKAGLDIMNCESVEYSGQPDTFRIQEPYFKYLLAAQLTKLGYGMGSWYDLPMTGTEDHKRITDLFTAERNKALMYAINNC
ncbi:MAG: hypothetical protein IJK07_11000 [Bacteroidales bacterium]|nr:hypothetical protein [Bacteroidales bacterium]MBQ6238730.1 hypothetical protein [Bacteroidales bacterium]